jgi:hypothetical protein
MVSKYLATLAVAVFLATFAASSLQFAMRSQVLSGKAVDETMSLEFTIDADSSHTYKIDARIKKFLQDTITFYTEGPVRVVSATVEVTPKDVTWTENRTTITSTGAAMVAHVKWETPPDSANGAHGFIYLNFPEIPGLQGKGVTFHSGGYQKDDQGRYIVREVTTYRNTFLLSFARFAFAFSAGLPFGIVLHSIFWAFVLKSEKRSRLAELPSQGSQLPRTFYPNPIIEWTLWTLLFGIGGFVASMMASFGIFDGYMSSSAVWVIFIILVIMAAIALASAYFTGKSVLTVRVDTNSISYARGRGELQWLTAAWSDILLFSQKSRTYRGSTRYWMELEFRDNRKKLKIAQDIEGYPALRDILVRVFTPQTQS